MRVLRVARPEFLEHYWHYKPGQHVAAFGPTQRAGKTQLLFELLQATLRPGLTPIAFSMKPRDRTAARWTRELGFKEVATWPPPVRMPWQERPAGYTLWPRHTYDPDVDNENLRGEFRKGMLHGYKKGRHILMLDEIHGICGELALTEDLLAILTRGGGMGCGAWLATQKPSGTHQAPLPGFVFNCPYHFFLAPDNDHRNRSRYAELSGGIDPDFIDRTTLQLQRFEFLYLNADGEMAIVGA